MIKGCLFDLDGTLVNSLLDLATATNVVLTKYGLPIHDVEIYNHYVGNGVKRLIERAIGENHYNLLEDCLKDFYIYYGEHCLDNTKPYSGIRELLLQLKSEGYVLGVVTNKPQYLAIKIVEALFENTFNVVLGQQDLYPTKPSPESTHLALMNMKVGKDQCIFIGDSSVDIQTAYNAEMDSIGVCWGFRNFKELKEAGATYIVFSPKEIKEILDDDRC